MLVASLAKKKLMDQRRDIFVLRCFARRSTSVPEEFCTGQQVDMWVKSKFKTGLLNESRRGPYTCCQQVDSKVFLFRDLV